MKTGTGIAVLLLVIFVVAAFIINDKLTTNEQKLETMTLEIQSKVLNGEPISLEDFEFCLRTETNTVRQSLISRLVEEGIIIDPYTGPRYSTDYY